MIDKNIKNTAAAASSAIGPSQFKQTWLSRPADICKSLTAFPLSAASAKTEKTFDFFLLIAAEGYFMFLLWFNAIGMRLGRWAKNPESLLFGIFSQWHSNDKVISIETKCF